MSFQYLKINFVAVIWLVTMTSQLRAQSSADQGFPDARSKKGLQVQMVDDALNLGVQHAAINLNLSLLIDPQQQEKNPSWELDGQRYHFRAGYLAGLERQIKPLSDRGVLVYMIMLVYPSGNEGIDEILVHPKFDQASRNRVAAFNLTNEQGRQWWRAAFEFLAHRWSLPDSPHGRVVGYIIGNEVNSHAEWANRGDVEPREFIDDYVQAVRLAFNSIRSQTPVPRVYLSFDHFWGRGFHTDRMKSIPGKEFLDRFAYVARKNGDFEWHLAYHPYPENLFEAAFWKDQSPTSEEDTPRITFKNLEVLTTYLERPELLYDGTSRRVILSEQGFHSKDDPASQQLQAAAYGFAWKKVESLPGVDAFIYHRHVDHAQEGGLNLGLWGRAESSISTPLYKKPIHKVMLHADKEDWEESFQFALPIIGQPDWETALKSLSAKNSK